MSERDHPVSALRTHVPDLERLAYNQKPKTRDWTYLRLLQYDETDLFQWFGKRNGSCFEDQASEPFATPPFKAGSEAKRFQDETLTSLVFLIPRRVSF